MFWFFKTPLLFLLWLFSNTHFLILFRFQIKKTKLQKFINLKNNFSKVYLYQRRNEWTSDHTSDQTNAQTDVHTFEGKPARTIEHTTERSNARTKNRPSNLTDVRMTDGTGEQSNERGNERTRKRKISLTNERTNAYFSQINLQHHRKVWIKIFNFDRKIAPFRII